MIDKKIVQLLRVGQRYFNGINAKRSIKLWLNEVHEQRSVNSVLMINIIGKINSASDRAAKSKILIIALFLNILTSFGQNELFAQNQSLIPHVQEQANIMGQSYLKGDYQAFARYTYPAIVTAMGGEKHMATVLTNSVANINAQGMSLYSITYDNASTIVRSNGELQCTLQQHTTINFAKGKTVMTSTLIALSEDGGKNWTFVDTNNKTTAMMRKVLPNLNPAIVIPPQPKPAFYSF